MKTKYRHTKIIFTIGPATEKLEVLQELIEKNVDICRLNMAHASREWTDATIKRIRKASEKAGRNIAIMMDIKGPEIRTGTIDGPWELKKNELIDIYMHEKLPKPEEGKPRAISVNYPGMIHDVKEGDTILVDSGLIRLKILSKENDHLKCKVLIPGPLTSKRHINLPGVKVNLPALTDKDKEDIKVGVKEGIAFFALSFVREAKDVEELRRYLKRLKSEAKIIAKIEDQSGIKNLEAIIEASDGVMVARGDLGIECPFEELPTIQKHIVKLSVNKAKPVIVATHMLESMIHAPIPTRAEVSDVAQAVYEQADAIMLSGETSVGKYPVDCIETMKTIASYVENTAPKRYNEKFVLNKPKNKMLRSAVVLAQDIGNTGILVFTKSGKSVQKLASLRPTRCPLYAFTDDFMVSKQLRLIWGVEPFLIDFLDNKAETIERAIETLKQGKYIAKKDNLIIMTSITVNGQSVNTIQLKEIL